MKSDYYRMNEDGTVEPCNVIDWADWIGDNNRRVALNEVGAMTVSTVFLGTDYGLGEDPPALFETMVLGGPHDQNITRYRTHEEALEGHARIVEMLRAAETSGDS